MYEELGIQFVKKDGVKTHFKVAQKTERVAKLLSLFTIGVFETDSVERRIVYKQNGQFFCSTVDDLCKSYFEKESPSPEDRVLLPEGSTFYSTGKNGQVKGFAGCIEGLHNVQPIEYSWELYPGRYYPDDDEEDHDKEEMRKHDEETQPIIIHIVFEETKYTAKNANYDRHGRSDDCCFYDFEERKCMTVDRIYDESEEIHEDMGNYGSIVLLYKNRDWNHRS